MKGIMSGLEPVRLEKGGFPDLTGDGKVTQADILKGRGVEGFAEGGGISQFVKDYIVDVEDPLDIALLSLYALGPVGAAANKAIKVARTAKKVAKKSDYKKSGIEELIQKTMVKPGGATAGFAGAYDITDVLLDDEEELPELKDGGVVHAFGGKFFSKALEKAKDALKKSGKKKKTGKTDKKPDDAPLGDTRPFYRKKRVLIPGTTVGGATGYGAYNYLTSDDNDRPEYNIEDAAEADKNKGGKANDLEDISMRAILLDRATARAKEAGRESPTFIDYLASFPGGYIEKVGKDPEFAKQMMAGFLAMMKPTEGYVPRSGIVDFGEAAIAEAQRQEESIPAAIQTLEYIRDNPDLQQLYKDVLGSKASTAVRGIDLFGDGASMQTIYSTIYQQKGGKGADPKLYDSKGKIVTEVELANNAATMDSDTFIEYLKTIGIKNE